MSDNPTKNLWRRSWPFIAGSSAALVLGLIVNQIHRWVELFFLNKQSSANPETLATVNWNWEIAWFLLLAALFATILFLWYRFNPWQFFPEVRGLTSRLASMDPRAHLVLFVSNLTLEDDVPLRWNAKNDGAPRYHDLTGNLDQDLSDLLQQAEQPHWPWEQMLRAIRPHLQKLEVIYCVFFVESFTQRELFRALLDRFAMLGSDRQFRMLLKSKVLVSQTSGETYNSGLDFEDFNQLAGAVRWLIDTLRQRGVAEESISVDFTGGQKVTSVVAVAETFDLGVTAQYVQTRGEKEVYSYDVQVTKVIPSV